MRDLFKLYMGDWLWGEHGTGQDNRGVFGGESFARELCFAFGMYITTEFWDELVCENLHMRCVNVGPYPVMTEIGENVPLDSLKYGGCNLRDYAIQNHTSC